MFVLDLYLKDSTTNMKIHTPHLIYGKIWIFNTGCAYFLHQHCDGMDMNVVRHVEYLPVWIEIKLYPGSPTNAVVGRVVDLSKGKVQIKMKSNACQLYSSDCQNPKSQFIRVGSFPMTSKVIFVRSGEKI